jgi:serine protease DegS
MTISALRRNAIFLAGSVLAGAATAFLVVRLWPDLLQNPMHSATTASVPVSAPAPVATPAPSPALEITPAAVTVRNDSPVGISPAAAAPEGVIDLLAQAPTGSFAPAVRASSPAVVSVYTERTVREFGNIALGPNGFTQQVTEGIRAGLGSGVIIDSLGHIVTNHHVIADADVDKIRVRLADGRFTAASIVGRDPDTDLAVLKISLQKLPVMKLGRSDRVAVGDVVLAIGSPFELLQTVTHGIVSATGRSGLGVALLEDFIQTDAAINEGNSGGALVNTRGELIGINTAVLGKQQGAEGIGVAIPVDLVRGVMHEILQQGRVVRGWIGIAPLNIPRDTSEAVLRANRLAKPGVAIWNIAPNSPAQKAGLAIRDMIETIDSQPVRDARDTLVRIASRKPGDTIKLTGMRFQQKFSVELKVAEAPTQPAK